MSARGVYQPPRIDHCDIAELRGGWLVLGTHAFDAALGRWRGSVHEVKRIHG